jgi:hypothetical protein
MTDATVTVVHPPILIRKRGRAGLRCRWWIHNSGRFDRPNNLWRAAITRLRRKGWIITGTEAAGRDANQFRWALAGTDWAYAHLSGAAEGECYATWDSTVAELVGRPWAHKLTDLTWTRSKDYGGKQAAKVHALVVRLQVIRTGRRYFICVVHMPLDNTPARAAAWVDCCQGLAELQDDLKHRDPDAELVIVGDWNKNLRIHDEAGMVRGEAMNRIAPYWKAAVAFVAPGAALLIAQATTGSIGSTDLIIDVATCVVSAAAVYAAPKNRPAA